MTQNTNRRSSIRSQFLVHLLRDYIDLDTGPGVSFVIVHIYVATFTISTPLSELSFTPYCMPKNLMN